MGRDRSEGRLRRMYRRAEGNVAGGAQGRVSRSASRAGGHRTRRRMGTLFDSRCRGRGVHRCVFTRVLDGERASRSIMDAEALPRNGAPQFSPHLRDLGTSSPENPAPLSIKARDMPPRYSHSIVPGGFDVMSYTTRFTPFTSFTIRVEIIFSTSGGSATQSAVMPSSELTARMAHV